MSKQQCLLLYLIAIFIVVVVPAGALDRIEVMALQDLYKTLDQPPQLKGWRLDAGWDPCNDPKYECTGVVCSGSSVRYLFLEGLNLTGYISEKISYLTNLRHLDLSSNNIGGEIPDVLSRIKSLKYVNLSHNLLSGHIGNALTGLPLKTMDLSYNNLTGDLPSSFGSLTNLSGLYLQNNRFTGSVSCLAELPLQDLYIQHNYFSGIIPKHFQSIRNLRFGGNRFHLLPGDKYPPPDVPSEYKAKPYNKILLVLQPGIPTYYGGNTTFPYWSVCGLWAEQVVQAAPYSDYVYYNDATYCDSAMGFRVGEIPEDLRNLLISVWRPQTGTSVIFWTQEFTKHGSCTQDILPTPKDYFEKGIELYANLIVDSILSPEGKYKPGNTFQTADLLDDIRFYNRAEPILECEGYRLVKVIFCYTTAWKIEYCFPKLPGPNTKSCPESIRY